jgi:hypothetical protein
MAAKFRNAGQTCVCANTFFVQRSVMAAFSAKLTARVAALSVGDGLVKGVQIGPLISPRAVEAMAALVADAVARGAVVRTGGAAGGGAVNGGAGNFFQPTVLEGVAPGAAWPGTAVGVVKTIARIAADGHVLADAEQHVQEDVSDGNNNVDAEQAQQQAQHQQRGQHAQQGQQEQQEQMDAGQQEQQHPKEHAHRHAGPQSVHTGAGPISNGARDHRIRLPAGFRHDVGKHGIGIIGYAHGRLRLRAGRAHQPLRHGSGAGGAGILFDQQHRGPRRPRRQRRHRAGGTATNHDDRHAIFELWPLRRLWITLDHPSPLAGNRRARNCGFAACAASAPPHAETSAQRTVWRAAAGACNAPDYGLQVMWP